MARSAGWRAQLLEGLPASGAGDDVEPRAPGKAGHDVENPIVVVHEQKQRMLGSH